MGHLRRGEGGPPTPSPPKAPWGLSLIGSLASHVTLCFSIKNHRPIPFFTPMDDPVLSPEAQQVIDRLRTLLSQLESTKKKREKCMADDPFFTPPQFGECAFCLKPCTIPVLLTSCCNEPCHLECTIDWKKKYHPPRPYPCCYQNHGLPDCLFCLRPDKHEHTFTRCCQQPCHEFCARSWTQERYPPRPCLYCRQALSTLTVPYPQEWKKDPHFVEQVKELWKDNPFWYCKCCKGKDTFEGFFGELQDPNEPTRKRVCFLGHTQSEVIPHMKASLSCQ